MCARDLSAHVMDPAHLDSYFHERVIRGFETKHGEKNIVVLALLCWLFMERIHPSFCALRAGAMRVGILGSEGSKRGNNSPQRVSGWRGPPMPPAFEIRCSRVHSSTHTRTFKYAQKDTENKQDFKRDSWPLSPPQVLLLTFLLRDKWLPAKWPTLSFFRLHCTH